MLNKWEQLYNCIKIFLCTDTACCVVAAEDPRQANRQKSLEAQPGVTEMAQGQATEMTQEFTSLLIPY